jgi:hypothetical protein
MIVISGHVSAPALPALATSTPRRRARSFVFHADVGFLGGGTATGAFVVGATGRSIAAIGNDASCATASRDILI